MLDPKIIREDPERIRKMLKNRDVDFNFDLMQSEILSLKFDNAFSKLFSITQVER